MSINLVIAADRNYLYPALVLIANLSDKGLWPDKEVKLWFLSAHGEMSAADQSLITSTVNAFAEEPNFQFVELDLSEMPETHGYLSKTALIRLLLPEFLKAKDWIWIDVDAILCTSWVDVKTAFFPVARTSSLVAANCHQVDPRRQSISRNPMESYFNSGVISWKSSGLEDGLRDRYLNALDEFAAQGIVGDDQDAMNFVHAGSVHLISGDYNAFGPYLFENSKRSQIKISHYAGPTKPWHLPDVAQGLCRDEMYCPWQPFYLADEVLTRRTVHCGPQTLEHLRSVKRRAYASGKPDWKVVWFAKVIARLPRFALKLRLFEFLRQGNYAHPLHLVTR